MDWGRKRQLHENLRINNTFIQMLEKQFSHSKLNKIKLKQHLKNLNVFFFYQGHNQKLAKKRGLDLTATNLSVSYKRWFGAKPFKVNAIVATYWYRKKMHTNKMLSKAFNFALNIDKRSASELKTKRSFRG